MDEHPDDNPSQLKKRNTAPGPEHDLPEAPPPHPPDAQLLHALPTRARSSPDEPVRLRRQLSGVKRAPSRPDDGEGHPDDDPTLLKKRNTAAIPVQDLPEAPAPHRADPPPAPVDLAPLRQIIADVGPNPTGLYAVKLRPGISVRDNGTIDHITVSSLVRTPSPLKRTMGDHTRSWTTLVDLVRARLFGKSLGDAVTTLSEDHAEAADWMDAPPAGGAEHPVGRQLFDLLPADDQTFRRDYLRYYSAVVRTKLDTAREAVARGDRGAAGAALEEAVGHHLAYLNFLPFSTVQPASGRGATGSGEGTARGVLISNEIRTRAAPVAAPPQLQDQPGPISEIPETEDPATSPRQLQDQLWKLFDFGAVLRGSGATESLSGMGSTIVDDATALPALRDELLAIIKGPHANPTVEAVKAVQQSALKIKQNAEPLGYAPIATMARSLEQIAERAPRASINTTDKKALIKNLEKYPGGTTGDVTVEEYRAELNAVRTTVEKNREGAPLVMAALIAEHQKAMATEYPVTVGDAEFLSDQPTDMNGARTRLIDVLKSNVRPGPTAPGQASTKLQRDIGVLFKQKFVDTFVDDVVAHYERINPRIERAADSGWAKDAANTTLVVTCSWPGGRGSTTINGRPDAPPGLGGGMGAHTTAETLEVEAVKALVTRSTAAQQVVDTLRARVRRALGSDVMKLDDTLPPYQLAAGQLGALFNAARDVLTSAEPADAIVAYLNFRNMLPYATVAASDTSGHGEGAAKKRGAGAADAIEVLYDQKAIDEAVTTQESVISTFVHGNVEKAANPVAALNEAAKQLTLMAVEATDLKDDITASAARLTAMAVELTRLKPGRVQPFINEVGNRMRTARHAEHAVIVAETAGKESPEAPAGRTGQAAIKRKGRR